MKLIARLRCQIDGRIVDPGDTIDYDGPVTDRIAYNFTDENGSSLVTDGTTDDTGTTDTKKTDREIVSDKVSAVLKAFSREQLMARLDEYGITYKPQHTNDKLARLYLHATGEID